MVEVFAGRDRLTGRKLYLRESTSCECEAEKIRTRLLAQVDARKHSTTRATFRVAMDKWLRTHDVEETTRVGYEQYPRTHLHPVCGDVSIGRVTAELLEDFYAELRLCSARCGRRPILPG